MTPEQIEKRIEELEGNLFSDLERLQEITLVAERVGLNHSVLEELALVTAEIQKSKTELIALTK